MQKEGIFYTTNIFKLVHANNPCTMWTSKNLIFIRATPCQRGFAAKCPVHKFRCVFLQNRALGPGGAICDFWPFCCHIFLKCLVRKGAVPEPAFRWTPNRPVFWRNAVPLATVRHVHMPCNRCGAKVALLYYILQYKVAKNVSTHFSPVL